MPAVNPRILTWARTTAGLSLADAASAIELKEALGISGADRLAALEAGESEPSRPLRARMAREYRRSLLVFYLNDPPAKGVRGKDFRTVRGGEPPLFNPVLDALIRDVRGRQLIIKSLLEDSDALELPFVASVDMRVSTGSLAEAIVRQIDFNLSTIRLHIQTTLIKEARPIFRNFVRSLTTKL